MASALQTAVLGMQAYQSMLDVTGNNIANADTIGYKSDRITFSDMFSRVLSKGTAGLENSGGTNPIEIGLGVHVSSIDKNMAQGNFTSTENDFDLAIDGQGFFVVHDGTSYLYTRDGTFDVDAQGYLVDPSTGYRLQRTGTVGEDGGFQLVGVSSIKIPYNVQIPGAATGAVDFKGNLSADDLDPTTSALRASGFTYTLIGGGFASASNDFSEVEQLQSFVDGETITITGRQNDGTAVSATFTYGAANDGTTLQDLLDVIAAAFGGLTECTAGLEEGKLTLTAATPGYSLLDIDLSCAAHTGAVADEFDYVEVGGASAQTTMINVYDYQSRSHALTATFVRHADDENVWDLVINSCSDATAIEDRRISGIMFDETGTFQGVTGVDGFGHTASDPGFGDLDANISLAFRGISSVQEISGDFGRPGFYDGLTQVGGGSSAGATKQDGYGVGSLQSIVINQHGTVTGTFTNGQTFDIASLRLAVFENPQGLERAGNNYFRSTTSAGGVVYSAGMQGRAGMVRQRALEESNVDVVKEFTRLIVAQRGFQVNSRTVSVINAVMQQMARMV